jgi:WD40 repeat protein
LLSYHLRNLGYNRWVDSLGQLRFTITETQQSLLQRWGQVKFTLLCLLALTASATDARSLRAQPDLTDQISKWSLGLPDEEAPLVAFLPDNSRAVFVRRNGQAELIDSGTGKTIQILLSKGAYRSSIAIDPAAETIVAPINPPVARINVFNVTQKLVRKLDTDDKEHFGGASVSSRHSLLCLSSDGGVALYDLKTMKKLKALKGDPCAFQTFLAVAISPDGSKVAGAGSLVGKANVPAEGVLSVWDVSSSQLLFTAVFKAKGVPFRHSALAFSRDCRQVIAGDCNGGIHVYDIASGKEKNVIDTESTVLALAYAPNGKTMAAGLIDGTIMTYNVSDWKPSGKTLGLDPDPMTMDPISSLSFSSDSTKLLTGTWTGTLCLWDLAGRTRLWTKMKP